jgi:hypothetical protein
VSVLGLIEREAVLSDLDNFVTAGSGVVVGVPGVGKTTLLHALRRRLQERDVPSVVVPIDRMGSDAKAELRELFGLDGADQHGQFDQLKAVAAEYQSGPGILIFDGFDAARKAKTQAFFLALIRRAVQQLAGTWHVIVTVRTFDAKRSQELLNLFGPPEPGTTGQYQVADIHCRHFMVPPLDKAEVKHIVASTLAMQSAYDSGSAELHDLLRIPFHLWLLDRMTSRDSDAADWSGIRSETQLLGLFWRQLVTGSEDREDREGVLSRITLEMVRSQQLSAPRRDLYHAEEQEAWRSLFSDGILDEDDTLVPRVAFAHNILFDYAASLYFLPNVPDELIRMLEANESRLFFLRPSLGYYYTRLWYGSSSTFWDAFWRLLESEAPRARIIARLLPPTIVANEARRSEDWSPVASALNRREPLAPLAVVRILQGLRMLDIGRDHLWTEFFELVAQAPDMAFAWDLGLLIRGAVDRANFSGDVSNIGRCGAAARSLLAWAWDHRSQQAEVNGASPAPWADALIASFGIPLVARTYATDRTESHALLKPILSLVESETFPIELLYRLSDAVQHIWTSDPVLVGAVYRTIFAHHENSDDSTEFGSPILPMSSTRRQDYAMCQFVLVQHAAGFLRAAPLEAATAIIDAINATVIAEHVEPYLREGHTLEDVSYHFKFRGRDAHYTQDLSSIWDQSPHSGDDIRQLASILSTLVAELGNQKESEDLARLVEVFRDHATVAMVWARLLRAAATAPEAFAPLLHELCLSRPIQIGSDTTRDLGRFLEAAAPYFSPEQMLAIEESLMGLTDQAIDDHRGAGLEGTISRLLARLPIEHLQSEAARRLREEARSTSIPPESGTHDFSRAQWGLSADIESRFEDSDQPYAGSSNDLISTACKQLDDFRAQWHQVPPTAEAVMSILPVAQQTWSIVERPDLDVPIRELAWSKVASCCEAISRASLDPVSAAFDFCREVLLASSKHSEPRPNPTLDTLYETPSWSPDQPRNEAAQGLLRLTGWRPDSDMLVAIKALASDPVPSVRFLVALELYRLIPSAPDTFWQLALTFAEQEVSRTVQEALCDALWRVGARDETRVTSILRVFASRLTEKHEPPAFPETLVALAVGLAFVRTSDWAVSFLDMLLSDPTRYADAIQQAVLAALAYCKPAQLDKNTSKQEAERTRDWIIRALDTIVLGIAAFRGALEADPGSFDLAEGQQLISIAAARAGMQTLYRSVDQVVTRFLFDADVDASLRNEQHTPLTLNQRKRFYWFVKPVVQHVLELAQPQSMSVLLASTAHNLMRLLRGMLAYDPRGVLELAAKVAVASETTGYSIDSLAVRDMVQLVEAALADHRSEMRQQEAFTALLTLLDVFARAGWPEALRLVWRLDEIYR